MLKTLTICDICDKYLSNKLWAALQADGAAYIRGAEMLSQDRIEQLGQYAHLLFEKADPSFKSNNASNTENLFDEGFITENEVKYQGQLVACAQFGIRATQSKIDWPHKWISNGFKQYLLDFEQCCYKASLIIFDAINSNLSKTQSNIADFHSATNENKLTLLHYPKHSITDNNSVRLPAHRDFGTITLQFSLNKAKGLQLSSDKKNWYHIKAEPGCFLVVCAELLERWSNNQLKAPFHRVISVAENNSVIERFSAAYFVNPAPHTMIDSQLFNPDEQPLYSPIRADDHIKAKFNEVEVV